MHLGKQPRASCVVVSFKGTHQVRPFLTSRTTRSTKWSERVVVDVLHLAWTGPQDPVGLQMILAVTQEALMLFRLCELS